MSVVPESLPPTYADVNRDVDGENILEAGPELTGLSRSSNPYQ